MSLAKMRNLRWTNSELLLILGLKYLTNIFKTLDIFLDFQMHIDVGDECIYVWFLFNRYIFSILLLFPCVYFLRYWHVWRLYHSLVQCLCPCFLDKNSCLTPNICYRYGVLVKFCDGNLDFLNFLDISPKGVCI